MTLRHAPNHLFPGWRTGMPVEAGTAPQKPSEQTDTERRLEALEEALRVLCEGWEAFGSAMRPRLAELVRRVEALEREARGNGLGERG